MIDLSLKWVDKRIEHVVENNNQKRFKLIKSILNHCKKYFDALLKSVAINQLFFEYKETPQDIKNAGELLHFKPMIEQILNNENELIVVNVIKIINEIV